MNSTKVIHTVIHALAFSLLTACSPSLQPHSVRKENIVIGKGGATESKEQIESMILPYRVPLQTTMAEVIATTDAAAVKALPESSLGNLVCDLMRSHAGRISGKTPDIAFYNTGGLRIELPKGDITLSMIYELAPFENELETIDVLGKDLPVFFSEIVKRKGGPIAGMTLGFDSKGNYKALISGKEVNPTQVYTIVSNDYLINGGDNYQMPPFSNRTSLKIKLRDALIAELRAIKSTTPLHPTNDGRIYLLDTP